ncbi:hypothetical protein D477_009615 [Arthrobacter crystallopoietes BAB-32]|uniref:Amylopullulanase X25 domain-containing protein n=1 Tax=Arthrobacter crystallopoietes BAB-32 TaxID=1246476 RepID=N1V851_9MICC|nr:hypothetical protein [Arthrobacter crystallopoietes]EMY34428.1 hypothetical protein D477_009615 [Arthrobacter crystallopoietes BAB-32]
MSIDNRLKAVLDSLAKAHEEGTTAGGSAVLAEAIAAFPLDARESELLSGGIPRGHKALTTATSKLVKAGWITKGRGGWKITEEGLAAAAAFPDGASVAAALNSGTPVPPLPATKAVKPRAKSAAAATAAAKKPAVAESAVAALPPAPEAPAALPAHSTAEAPAESKAPQAPAVPQPDAVAIAGNFAGVLGCPSDWEPDFDQVQMQLDPADQLWKLEVDLPAGFYTYKAALNRSWDENYGAFGQRDGANHEFHHGGGKVRFHYDHRTKDVIVR